METFVEKSSYITPLGALLLVIIGVCILVIPRKYAILPIIFTVCYLTIGQQIVIYGASFSAFRIALFLGWIRILIRREFSIRLNTLDKILLSLILLKFVMAMAMQPDFDQLKFQLGQAYDVSLSYFLIRILVSNLAEIVDVLRYTALIITPLAISMIFEKIAGTNLFSIFGGVPEFPLIRDGRLRCQGPFRHPILAGSFGASLFPYFWGLFQQNKREFNALIGMAACIAIIYASASIGPLLTFLFGITVIFMWSFRKYMKFIQGIFLFGVVSLVFVMKAPIWSLPGKISSVFGGTGYHRYVLIEQAIDNFGQWWLCGTNYTANWAWPNSPLMVLPEHPNMVDITSEYILVGIQGGIFPLLLFLFLIFFAFHTVGRNIKAIDEIRTKKLLWAFGAVLFVHATTFISVAYFDQMKFFWFMCLAFISTTSSVDSNSPARK